MYDAGANTGDDGGGVSEASSSGASAISMAQTHPKEELLDLVFRNDYHNI